MSKNKRKETKVDLEARIEKARRLIAKNAIEYSKIPFPSDFTGSVLCGPTVDATKNKPGKYKSKKR